jgi:hypothetical protein
MDENLDVKEYIRHLSSIFNREIKLILDELDCAKNSTEKVFSEKLLTKIRCLLNKMIEINTDFYNFLLSIYVRNIPKYDVNLQMKRYLFLKNLIYLLTKLSKNNSDESMYVVKYLYSLDLNNERLYDLCTQAIEINPSREKKINNLQFVKSTKYKKTGDK